MKNKTSINNKRRQLLKSAAMSGGVAGVGGLTTTKWVKPLVSAVVLPVHAQTTPGQRFIAIEDVSGFVQLKSTSKNDGLMLAKKIKQLLISPAYAVELESPLQVYLEQLTETVFKLVIDLVATQFGVVFISANYSGEVIIGVETDIEGISCQDGVIDPDSTTTVKLVSVSLGNEAKIEIFDGELNLTLQFAPTAMPPEFVVCV